ncbi:putative metal-binding motif-containing protein, partial [Candidatus Uhrbacteria bacterium]|nr:putative metal-binding motif-containing protein [Candidatus Uhrbacteria bacterium]
DADGDGAPDAVDCAPADPLIYPGAAELCNFVDDNCDGVVDDCLPSVGTIVCMDTEFGLDVTVNGGISIGLIDPVPPGEVITTVEIGADLDDCWNEAVSCFPTAYVGDGMDHLFSFGYTRFTPRIRTDLGTVDYLDLREWTVSGACMVEYDGGSGLRLNGLP